MSEPGRPKRAASDGKDPDDVEQVHQNDDGTPAEDGAAMSDRADDIQQNDDGTPAKDAVPTSDRADDAVERDDKTVGSPTDKVPEANKKPVRGRPFKKGVSPHPRGRPKGSPNKGTAIAKALIGNQIEALVQKQIEIALNGSQAALKSCLQYGAPLSRDELINMDLPSTKTASGCLDAVDVAIAEMADGKITPAACKSVVEAIQMKLRLIETADLAERIAALERLLRTVPKLPEDEE